MTRSFFTAISGLRAHQQWLDVIGNNLANANTTGFKGSRALFSSLLSQTYKSGSPANSIAGGTNPMQVGLGIQLAAVDRDHSQGNLSFTGRPFDLALAGQGFFALSDGDSNVYTRSGTFGLDSGSQLVDVRTGYRVLDGTGQPITLDTAATIDPEDTTEVLFTGNLPAEVTGPLAEVLESGAPFNSGTAANLAGTATGPFTVPDGETWTMRIAMDGKASQEIAVTSVGGTITAQQIADEINLELGAGTATVNGGGQLEITSSKVGKSSTVLVIPGGAGQDLSSIAGLSTNLVAGTQQVAEETTDLNDLVSNDEDYQTGDLIRLSGTNAAGDPVESTFTYGTDGTTLADLASFVDSMYTDASASFNASTGKIQLESDASGEANLSLVILDEEGQIGGTNWANTAFSVSTDGTGPDSVSSSIQVYDTLGVPHLVSFEFERLDDGSWGISAELPDEDGTVFNGQLTGIVFDSEGKLPGQLTLDLQVQFGEQPPTDISLKLGGDDDFAGITQFGGETSLLAADQDGSPPGELSSVTVDGLGNIIGIYSNGQDRTLGDVGVATFSNDRGLLSESDSYFRASSASGQARFGALGNAGEVVAGALESANVDTSLEFVQLIEAQRGYQANARVISIQDRMLEEALNIV